MSDRTKSALKLRDRKQASERTDSAPDSPPVITRAEHHAFGSLSGLTRKAGGAVRNLAKTVAKELGDNALDKAESCTFGRLKRSGFYVQNEGAIPGKKRDVAALLSTGRPQTSTKLYRLPTRGALGNGLRVVAGAVLASGGRLVVRTGGRCLLLKPRPDGTTAVRKLHTSRPLPAGVTRVAVWLGPDIPVGKDVLDWVALAAELAAAPNGRRPAKRPVAHWHTRESFADLLRDAAGATVHQIVKAFDGLSGGTKASEVCGDLSGAASAVSRADAAVLLGRMKEATAAPSHDGLGRVGDLPGWGRPKREDTSFTEGGVRVPARVEAWARPAQKFEITVCVNHTPCPIEVTLRTGKNTDGKSGMVVSGAGLNHWFPGRGKHPVEALVNVQCPAVPLVSDGKAPDLAPIAAAIVAAVEGVVKTAAARATSAAVGIGSARGSGTQKAVIRRHLAAAVESISLRGKVVYTLRNLFYALRPRLIGAIGREPKYNTFARIVAEYEDERGELPGLCRDNRGTLHEPHTGKQIPLGTLTAKSYKRPSLLFNKIVYCEKEGLFPLLINDGWPERHDCALLTSKGFATRAVGDLLALMDESDEPLTIFCVHDADGPGTVIFQALQELVSRRGGRHIRVINLGLDPDEAMEMLLQIEPVTPRKNKTVPTGNYLSDRWKKWLQTQRVELNAIDPADFISWLDRKMRDYDGKVIPPDAAVEDRVRAAAEAEVRERIREQILRDAGFEGRVAVAMTRLEPALEDMTAQLADELPRDLARPRREHWGELVDEAGVNVVADEFGPQTAHPEAS